jgi:hypothetical protein
VWHEALHTTSMLISQFSRSTGLSVRQILADRVDVLHLIASVIVNLNVRIEPLEYKILLLLAVSGPIWDIGDYDPLISVQHDDL